MTATASGSHNNTTKSRHRNAASAADADDDFATKTQVHKTRRRHPSQSNTLLSHGFTKAAGDVKPTAPSVPARAAAGRKRTRSAADQHDIALPNGGPVGTTATRRNKYETIAPGTSGNQPGTSVSFAVDVKTAQPATANGNGTAAPSTSRKPDAEKRTLRSQDGTSRLNSDLSIYFGDFDNVMSGAAFEPEPLKPETRIMIVDEPIKGGKGEAQLPLRGKQDIAKSPSKSPAKQTRRSSETNGLPAPPMHSSYTYPTSSLMNGAHSLDLTAIAATYTAAQTKPDVDPLADEYYLTAHRRGERKEKQLRNQEREHAMHEKGQLEGLLEGLKGPDWLRVMGVTGITEGESKDWKGKRDHFMKEVQALLDKFALWREEEKRMKAERDAKLAAAETEGEEEEEDVDEMAETATENGEDEDRPLDDDDDADTVSTGPNSSDLDASAAQQLLEEASNARRRPEGKRQVRLSHKAMEVKSKPLAAHMPPPPPGPFTSFYPAPHLRSQALGKQRHGGRKETAFGRPLPDVADADFVLPKELTSPDALRIHERKRRRLRRDAEEQKKDPGLLEDQPVAESTSGPSGRGRRRR